MSHYEAGKTKLFISYSKEDLQYKETLLKQLKPLKNRISVWHDRLILPGQKWDEVVKAALNEADIVLLLVSANSIATDYIQDVEIPIIKKREAAGECIFVPVILNYCLWDVLDFAKHNSLPTKGVPITASNWRNEAEAWMQVVLGIQKLLP